MVSTCERIKSDPHLQPYLKYKKLKHFTGQGKYPRRVKENLHNIVLDHDFLRMTPKSEATKAKG